MATAKLSQVVLQFPKANPAALTAVDDSLVTDGVLAYVISLKRIFKLDKSNSESANNYTVIATNSGTGRWVTAETRVNSVSSSSAMVALGGSPGDIAIRTDLSNQLYFRNEGTSGSSSDWTAATAIDPNSGKLDLVSKNIGDGYTFLANDTTKILVVTTAGVGGTLITLGNPATLGNKWYAWIKNKLSTAVQIDDGGSGYTIDGQSGITLPTESSIFVWCDGLAYYTLGDQYLTEPVVFVQTSSAAGYTLTDADHGKILEFSNASTTVNLTDAVTPGFQCELVYIGSGTLTISPNTQTLNGASTLSQNNNFLLIKEGLGTWRTLGGNSNGSLYLQKSANLSDLTNVYNAQGNLKLRTSVVSKTADFTITSADASTVFRVAATIQAQATLNPSGMSDNFQVTIRNMQSNFGTLVVPSSGTINGAASLFIPPMCAVIIGYDSDNTNFISLSASFLLDNIYIKNGVSGIQWSGAGAGFYFSPAKRALRAGTVTGSQWDNSNVGNDSVGFGTDCAAIGDNSFSTGNGNTAGGNNSATLAGSNNNIVSVGCTNSVVVGGSANQINNNAQNAGILLGNTNSIAASGSLAMGQNITIGNGKTNAIVTNPFGGGFAATAANQFLINHLLAARAEEMPGSQLPNLSWQAWLDEINLNLRLRAKDSFGTISDFCIPSIREIFIPLGDGTIYQNYNVKNVGSAGTITCSFQAPIDFVELFEFYFLGIAQGTNASISATITTYFGATNPSGTTQNSTANFGVVTNEVAYIGLSTPFSGLQPLDSCSVKLTHNTIGMTISYYGAVFRYRNAA